MISKEHPQKPLIRVRGLHKYFGNLHLLKGLDLDVMPGEVLAIIGPSGVGKSVFLRCLNFLEMPSAGSIEIDGISIDISSPVRRINKKIREIRKNASMIFQDFNLFSNMTVLENIIEGAVTVKGEPKNQAIARAEALLAGVGLSDKRHEYPSRLAYGQRQQIAIARSLCMEPKIMLFDDPTSALDPESSEIIAEAIEGLTEEGITMIVVTHELRLARRVARRVIFMDEGKWVEMAPPEVLFNHPQKERTRQFLSHMG